MVKKTLSHHPRPFSSFSLLSKPIGHDNGSTIYQFCNEAREIAVEIYEQRKMLVHEATWVFISFINAIY